VEEPLLLHVPLDQVDPLLGTAGEPQVAERLVVDREDGAGGPELGGHVPDRGTVGQRQGAEPRTVELDEAPHHALLAEHLGDGEHQVGRRRSLGKLAHQAEPGHVGNQHGDGLAEHGRLRLDPSHAPPQHAKAVHHGGVGVGADERIGIGERSALAVHLPRVEDDAGQVLEVDLVHDARTRRHHLEVAEGPLPPTEEPVTLLVPLELLLHVDQEGGVRAVCVHLHRVVDHQLRRLQRVDPAGITPQPRHGVAHGGEVHDCRHPGEVLQEDARRVKAISFVDGACGSHLASRVMSSADTERPSSVRRRFSRRMRREKGNLPRLTPSFSSASSRNIS
jgi:hypothetical protein